MNYNKIRGFLAISGMALVSFLSSIPNMNSKAMTARIETEYQKVKEEPETIKDILNDVEKTIVLNLEEQKTVEETTLAQTEPATEPEPIIEIIHHVPTYEQIVEYILKKRAITKPELLDLFDYCLTASHEYGIAYQSREDIARVFYLVIAYPEELKRKYIMERWGMTAEELRIAEETVSVEAKRMGETSHWGDAFAVTVTAIGRTKDGKTYAQNGGDVYDQFTASHQFTGYKYHEKYSGETNNGVLDALFAYAYCKDQGLTPLRTRFFLEFRSASTNMFGTVQLFPNGNNFRKDKYNEGDEKFVLTAKESIDSYEPYVELTDEKFHQILEDRGLCYHEEVLKRTR